LTLIRDLTEIRAGWVLRAWPAETLRAGQISDTAYWPGDRPVMPAFSQSDGGYTPAELGYL
jgi:hypothetical protein